MSENLFVLAGNGSYDNRGCEAIIRGTTEILNSCFKNPKFLVFSNFINKAQYEKQKNSELDQRIAHRGLVYAKRYSFRWAWENTIERVSPVLFREMLYSDLKEYLVQSKAILSVGGDNYSLDYGEPTYFVHLNNYATSKYKSLIIWGASIGPFSDNPSYEKFISKHLKKVIIFARENETVEYLLSLGLKDNVYRMADPAFLLKPEQPSHNKLSFKIEEGAVGINLSPLMAKYVTGGDANAWLKRSAEIIKEISNKLERPIYLIPHVMMPGNDDYVFMRDVCSIVDCNKHRIFFVPPVYNAAESKWFISKMYLFVGARTHATIAAFSTAVPTLSLGYSAKAQGINKEIYGHTNFCITGNDICADIVVSRLKELLFDKKSLVDSFNKFTLTAQQCALRAGNYLQRFVK